MGAFTYDVSKILANFTPSPCQQLSAFSDPPPDDVSICQTPYFKVTYVFQRTPYMLHSTLIETLNVYFIQLKTERCHHSGEYINTVVSGIVIGTLDLKQFLPKFKYVC